MPLSRINNPFLSSSGAGNASITSPAANTLAFTTTTTERMRIDSSGNVGIGVTPSAWATYEALQIDNGAVANYSPSQDASYLSNAYYNGGWKYIASAYAVRYAQDGSGGNHRWYSAPTGTAGNAITFTQVLGVNKGTTLALEGATSASGTGIAFPATQSASSNANTLDDYEEGTFTPTISGGTTAGTTTYSNQQGSYTKIGRKVTISIRLTYSAATGTGEYRVGGFPFTVSNDSMEYIAPLITSNLNWNGGTYIQVYVIPNTTQATLFYCADDAGWGVQQMVNESDEIRFTATYFV